jgi:hypothetical protein
MLPKVESRQYDDQPSSVNHELVDGVPSLDQMQWTKILALALPRWSAQHNANVAVEVSVVDDGISIQFKSSELLSAAQERSLLERIFLAEQLVAHQALVDAMKEIGVSHTHIAPVIDRGQNIAAAFSSAK